MDPLVSMLNLYEKDFVKFKDVMQINKPELLEFARNYEIIIRNDNATTGILVKYKQKLKQKFKKGHLQFFHK